MAVDFGDHRVMACNLADLRRWLREVTADPALELVDGVAEILLGDDMMRVRARTLPPRRIALVSIQQLEVRFEYPDSLAGLARAWIRRFDRHTQRGGG